MGSKGSTTQQTNQVSQYTPSPQITAAGTQALQGGQAAAQQPFWLPQQPVAGFTPDQLAAFQNVRNMQGMTAPWFGQAGTLAQQSATPLTADQIANFYNPMAQNVTNQLQNIYGQQMRETTGKLTQAAGGVGADRIAVGQANLANQQGLASGQIYAQLYQQALQAAMQNQQMQGQAAFAMGNLGQGAQGAALQANQALLGTGGLQQQLAQAQLMSPYAWLGQQFAYPYQANQYLAGVTGSLVPAFPSTTTGQSTQVTTPPQPSPLSQGLGLGMAGLGAMQNFGYNPFAAINAGNIGGTGGGLGGLYAHGGRVHRQVGGQAGMPQLPPQASQMAEQFRTAMPAGALPGNTGPRPGFGDNDADDIARRSPAAGANPQAALQQAMQSPQFQQLLQRFPWLQQMMQNPMQRPQMPQMPQQGFGTGTKGAFSWPGRSFADGGAVKPPAIPAMGAGTASDMDAYFSKINDQAQNLAAMSRFAMQPTGSGGWRQSSFVPGGGQTPPTGEPTQSGQLSSIFGRSLPQVMRSPFHPSALNPQETVQPMDFGGGQPPTPQGGFQQGGGVGQDPFGETDSFVPDIHLTMPNFHGPDLPKLASNQGSSSSSSGKGSGIGQAIGVAAQVLPLLMAARGGGVGPFSHYQHFQEGGGDDMTDVNAFPFTPPDAPSIAPYATPQEAEQARLSKELFAKQVAATPVGGQTPEIPVAKSPFAPLPPMTTPEEEAGKKIPAAMGRMSAGPPAFTDPESGWTPPDIQATAPVTPVQRGDIPKSPFDLPVQTPPTGQGGLFEDEKQRQAMSAGMPQAGVPMPPPRPELTQAPMPPPRPDIAGPAGQAFARTPPIPVSRQSIAQDAIYEAKRAGIDPNVFLRLINRESGFNPNSRGAAGEIGLGQLMPGTAREMGVQNPWDPKENLRGAADYFKQQLDRFGGDYHAAAMAYNAGPGAVSSGRIPASSRAYAADVAGGGPFDTTQLSAKSIAGGPPEGPTGTTPSTPEQYTLPAGQTPFPQAGMQYPGMSLAQNPLFRMGANIAASRSPWPAVAIGEGMSTWAKGAQEEAGKQVTANQAAQRLWLDMQKHVDTMTKLTPAQQAANWHSTYDLNTGKPLLWKAGPDGVPQVYTIENGRIISAQDAQPADGGMAGPPTTAPVPGAPSAPGVPAAAPTAQEAPQSSEVPTNTSPSFTPPTPDMVTTYQGGGPRFTSRGTPQPAVEDARKSWEKYRSDAQPAMANTESNLATIFQDADAANKDMLQAGGLGKFLLTPGPGAGYRNQVAAYIRTYGGEAAAKQFGIPPNVIADITSMDKAQQYLTNALTRALGAREAVQVLQMNKTATPGWEQTEEGRIKVANDLWQQTQRTKDLMNFAQKWDQMNNGDMRGMMTAFDAANPVTRYAQRAQTLAGYDLRTYSAPEPVKAKIYELPKAKQWEMYDRAPMLQQYKNDPGVRAAVNKRYNGLADYIMGPP